MVATGDGNNAGINGKDGTVNVYGGTVVTVGGGSGKGISGSLTVGNTLTVYGDDYENPTTVQTDYSSNRWKYMTVKPAPLTSGPYIDATGTEQECAAYTAIGSDTATWSDNGWYAAISNVTIDQAVTVSGTVNLILNDGVTLTVNGGITGGTLNIYAQQRGSGSLTVTGGSGDGISSALNLNGGSVNATGGANGAGVNGAVTVTAGSLTAKGVGTGDGIAGSSLTVHDGVVTATSTGGAGISSATLTVKDGTMTATGATKGISSAAISITGADRMVQGGDSSASIAPITALNDQSQRTPYMVVGESVYTIFYKVENGWTIPRCAYNDNTPAEMEQDGEYWRLTVHEMPLRLTFSDGATEASTGQQVVNTISTVSGNAVPTGTQIGSYGTFFVVSGGCRMVTFVSVNGDGSSRVEYVTVPDGGLVACPDEPPEREGFRFLGWGQYNFNSPVKSSMTIYARYYQEHYYVDFYNVYGGWYGNDSNASVRAQFADQRVPHGGTARNPGTPPKPEAGSVFQGWVLMDTIQYKDGNNTVTLPAGTIFDFSTPVTCKIRLKASWVHVHAYGNTVESVAAYLTRTTEYYNNNDAYQLRLNNSGHYKFCTTCGQATLVPHTLDANNHCTVCGVTIDNSKFYEVSYEARDLTKNVSLGSKTFKAGNTSGFPWYQAEEGALFMSYLVYDVTNPDNEKLIRTETNPNNKIFTVDRNLKIVATYRNRYQVYADSSVKLSTSAVNSNTASLELSWSLPAGYGFTSAGILTTTNKELNKFSYSFLTKTQTTDSSNLLKAKQSDKLYTTTLQEEMRSHMLAGTSYDPNLASTIHSFQVKSIARSGSYQVPHELPTGEKAKTYGPWVYAMGYLTYTDTQGNTHTIYTQPVAVSTTDPTHEVEYVYHD